MLSVNTHGHVKRIRHIGRKRDGRPHRKKGPTRRDARRSQDDRSRRRLERGVFALDRIKSPLSLDSESIRLGCFTRSKGFTLANPAGPRMAWRVVPARPWRACGRRRRPGPSSSPRSCSRRRRRSPRTSSPSWLSTTTRTLAAVPARSLMTRTLKSTSLISLSRGKWGSRAFRKATSRALTGPSPSPTVCSRVADPELDRGLGDRAVLGLADDAHPVAQALEPWR